MLTWCSLHCPIVVVCCACSSGMGRGRRRSEQSPRAIRDTSAARVGSLHFICSGETSIISVTLLRMCHCTSNLFARCFDYLLTPYECSGIGIPYHRPTSQRVKPSECLQAVESKINKRQHHSVKTLFSDSPLLGHNFRLVSALRALLQP